MRPTRILLLASLALAVPSSAHALPPGVCVASTVGVDQCVPRVICGPGDVVTVIVAGHGTGLARCGGATAACAADGACTDTATASYSNALLCDVDPWGTDDVSAVCIVTPGASQ